MKQGEIFHNRYYLTELIGNGGFSQVWKAQDMQSGLELAIKIFIRQDEEGIRLCRREFSKTYQLRHAHILTPMHFDVVENIPYLVMPFITGGTLEQRIGHLDMPDFYRFVDQIGSVLKYIHYSTNPVVHGDIKPDNVLIDANGNYLLTDFGISTELKEKFTQTMNMDQFKSKPSGITPLAFRAPELNEYKDWVTQTVSPKSDIWSAGIVLYNLCKGKLPFNGDGGLGQLIMMRTSKCENVSEFLELDDIPADLRKLIVKCLQLNPLDRPALFEPERERGDSGKFAPAQGFNAPAKSTVTGTVKTTPSKNRRNLILFLFFVLSVIAGLSYWVINQKLQPVEAIVQDSPTEYELPDAHAVENEEALSSEKPISVHEPKSESSQTEKRVTSTKTGFPEEKSSALHEAKSDVNHQITFPGKKEETSILAQSLSKPTVTESDKPENKSSGRITEDNPIHITPAEKISGTEKNPVTDNNVNKENPEIKSPVPSAGFTKVTTNIPIKLALKTTIPLPHNLDIGQKVTFWVIEDVMGQTAVFLKKNAEVEAIVKRVSDDKITIEFPHVYSSGNTRIKTYRSRFDISSVKGQPFLAKATEYKVVIYSNEKLDVKL